MASVDVFLFIALTDAGPKGRNLSGHRHGVDELSPCKDILKPVHVELMPETYPMPKHESCLSEQDMPNYWNQNILACGRCVREKIFSVQACGRGLHLCTTGL